MTSRRLIFTELFETAQVQTALLTQRRATRRSLQETSRQTPIRINTRSPELQSVPGSGTAAPRSGQSLWSIPASPETPSRRQPPMTLRGPQVASRTQETREIGTSVAGQQVSLAAILSAAVPENGRTAQYEPWNGYGLPPIVGEMERRMFGSPSSAHSSPDPAAPIQGQGDADGRRRSARRGRGERKRE
jgi:hypothetical protein